MIRLIVEPTPPARAPTSPSPSPPPTARAPASPTGARSRAATTPWGRLHPAPPSARLRRAHPRTTPCQLRFRAAETALLLLHPTIQGGGQIPGVQSLPAEGLGTFHLPGAPRKLSLGLFHRPLHVPRPLVKRLPGILLDRRQGIAPRTLLESLGGSGSGGRARAVASGLGTPRTVLGWRRFGTGRILAVPPFVALSATRGHRAAVIDIHARFGLFHRGAVFDVGALSGVGFHMGGGLMRGARLGHLPAA